MYKNLILLFKWWWRFSETDNSLWKRILLSVHKIKGLKASSDAFSLVKGGIWGQMMSNEIETSKVRSIVDEGMQLRVGNGASIRFWHDKWCDVRPLKLSFPRLFNLSLQKHSLVGQMGNWGEVSWSWNIRWRRPLFDWEASDANRLMDILAPFSPQREGIDGILWHGSSFSSFSIKQIVNKTYDSVAPIIPKDIIKIIWQSCYPPRAQLTIWMACLGKLKTGELLLSKGIIDHHQALCPFCNSEVESLSHVLFSCSFSWGVWMEMLKWWGISGVLQNQCREFILAWIGLMKRKKWKKIWKLILGCVLWSIWYASNKAKFEAIFPNLQHFIYSIKIRIHVWANELLLYAGHTQHDFIHNLPAVIS